MSTAPPETAPPSAHGGVGDGDDGTLETSTTTLTREEDDGDDDDDDMALGNRVSDPYVVVPSGGSSLLSSSSTSSTSSTSPADDNNSSPLSSSRGAYDRLVRLYDEWSVRYPLTTSCVSHSLVNGWGSLLALILLRRQEKQPVNYARIKMTDTSLVSLRRLQQRARRDIPKQSHMDWTTVVAFLLQGALVEGPIHHYWSQWMTRTPPLQSKTTAVLRQEFLLKPPLLVLNFVVVDVLRKTLHTALVDGGPWKITLQQRWRPTLTQSWRYWPLTIYLIWRFLKRKHHALASSVAGVVWAMYMTKQSLLPPPPPSSMPHS